MSNRLLRKGRSISMLFISAAEYIDIGLFAIRYLKLCINPLNALSMELISSYLLKLSQMEYRKSTHIKLAVWCIYKEAM